MANLSNLDCIPKEEFSVFISKISPNELELVISSMSNEQLKLTFQQMNKNLDPKWKLKTRSAILGLNNRPQLEIAASALSVDQMIELIDKTLQVEDKHHWKLSPLLVGLSFEVFKQLLLQASDFQLQVLQHEGVTEPVQHRLTILSHEMSNQIKEIERELDLLDEEIEQLDINTLSREDVFELQHRFEIYAKFFENKIQCANKALAIAWNTNRLDLIESLNKIKDSCQKYNLYGIGQPHSQESSATGLYKKLEGKLFSVYGKPDENMDREALYDSEPAIEALVKFSLWYLRDYWEIGLLPTICNVEDLDVDLQKYSETERVLHREKLFKEAKENLEKIGLKTVLDLKNAYIFSKKTLQGYIQEFLK